MIKLLKYAPEEKGLDLEKNILDQVLRVMALGAIMILCISSFRMWFEGFEAKYGLIWAVALGLISLRYFAHNLAAITVGYILFALFSAMGFLALANDGLASIGSIFLFLALSTSAMVVGTKKLLVLIGFQFIIFSLLILMVKNGAIVPLPEQSEDYLLSPKTWFFHGSIIAGGAAMSFYASSILGQWYRDNFLRAQDNFYNAVSLLSLARDTETGEHINRVSKYTEILYDALKRTHGHNITFSRDDISKAARLHDVGKVATSDAILKKPGKLTAEEFKEMERHCEIGADIIASISSRAKTLDPVLELAENIARSHHENWDGSGYPDGLKDKEIPLEARIMAIADVYDALRSRRPYKDPYSAEHTLKIMRSMRGAKFDPELFDRFWEVKDQFERAYSNIQSYKRDSLQ